MHRWSAREVDYLVANASDGAQAVADALGRTVASVQMKAHRLGISLHPRWMCPRCARWTYRPLSASTGWCESCTIRESIAAAKDESERIRNEKEEERRRIKNDKRELHAAQQDKHRQSRQLRRIREKRKRSENGTV